MYFRGGSHPTKIQPKTKGSSELAFLNNFGWVLDSCHHVPKIPFRPKTALKVFFSLFSEVKAFLGDFYLKKKWVGLFYLRLVLAAIYGKLAWSFLLAIAIRFGLFCLRWRIWVWSFLLTVPPPPPVWKLDSVFSAYGSPCPEIGFGLLCLHFPHRK